MLNIDPLNIFFIHYNLVMKVLECFVMALSSFRRVRSSINKEPKQIRGIFNNNSNPGNDGPKTE